MSAALEQLVAGQVIPWNFPLLLFGWGTSPALAAGNTVIVKPAEDTPLSTIYVARLAREAGLPDGVVNVVPGSGATAGAALSASPGIKRMSFTGSPEVGRLVGEACGRNLVPVKLELGGKGAAVVFEDVDVEETATKLVGAITFHTGQVCCDATRWVVHESIYDDFMSRCQSKLQNVHVDYQLSDTCGMGPVVNAKQRERVLSYLEKGVAGGAEAVVAGGAADVPGHDGYFVKPALLAGSFDNVAARDEIFGPVLSVLRFRDTEELVRRANATSFGLAAAVWTRDVAKAHDIAHRLRAGTVWVNCYDVFDPAAPFGGFKQSGFGRELGERGLDPYLETKTVTVSLG